MGIKERREREKQITRQAILNAALQIARQEGWPSLTIRKVGELIEYSPPMIYEYFKNKEEILLELIHEGFRQLTSSLQEARATTTDCEAGIHKMLEACWSFAMRNQELYQLMQGLAGVSLDTSAIAQEVEEICAVVKETLEDWAHVYHVQIEDSLGATEILWSIMQGMVSILLANRSGGDEQRAHDLTLQAIQDQLTAWKIKHS